MQYPDGQARFKVLSVAGLSLSTKRWRLWGTSIRQGAQWVPEDEVIRVVFDKITNAVCSTVALPPRILSASFPRRQPLKLASRH